MDLSIIIPVYNEEDNIFPLRDKLNLALEKLDQTYEIVIVNDGSTDATAQRLDELAAEDDRFHVFHLSRNFGQTAAIMAAVDNSTGEIIISMDGDLQNDPEDIPRLLEKLDEGYDVCSGWRVDRKDNPVTRNFPSRLANRLISRMTGVRLHDYGCLLKAYRRSIMKDVKLYGEMHRFIPIYAFGPPIAGLADVVDGFALRFVIRADLQFADQPHQHRKKAHQKQHDHDGWQRRFNEVFLPCRIGDKLENQHQAKTEK